MTQSFTLCCAAHWEADTPFSSKYVPFNDVKSGKASGETYSLDEVRLVGCGGGGIWGFSLLTCATQFGTKFDSF